VSTGRHTFRLNDLKRVIRAAKDEGFAFDVELARDKAIVRTKSAGGGTQATSDKSKDGEQAADANANDNDAREWQDEIPKLKAKAKPKAKPKRR